MDESLTTEDVAALLKCRPMTVRKLAQSGRLPSIKIGIRYRFSQENVKRFLAGEFNGKAVKKR